MGILDSTNQPVQEDIAKLVARRAVDHARTTFINLLSRYEEGTRLFWNNPRGASPADIASNLGTDAAEIFRLHYAVGQFLETIKPGCTSSINAMIPLNSFTINEDGTVTIQQA